MKPSPIPRDTQLKVLPWSPASENKTCNIDVYISSNINNSCIGSSLVAHNIEYLYLDCSKTQDNSREGFVLADPINKKHILACHLEFK